MYTRYTFFCVKSDIFALECIMRIFWRIFFPILIALNPNNALAGFEGEYAYNFSLPSLSINKPASLNRQNHERLSDYRGKVIWLEFWASWCQPCREIFPKLNTLRNELRAQGFEVIAISIDQNRIDATDFLQQTSVDFPVLHDEDGRISRAFAVRAIPTGILINQQGVIIFSHQGNRKGDIEKLRDEIMLQLDSIKIDKT